MPDKKLNIKWVKFRFFFFFTIIMFCMHNKQNQGYQFYFVSFEMAKTFYINLKNGIKQNNFHLILNLDPFRIFQLNFGRNVPVSFHMFRSGLEKPLNQIKPGSI
jgi:hypothetical protein